MKLKNIKEGKTMPYVLWVLDGDDRQWKMYKGVNDAKKFIADNDYDEFLDALNTQVFPNATYHNNYIDWIVIPAGEEPRKFDTHKFYNALRTESNKVTKKKSMKESYSDIDYDNLWEAYDIAADVLGYEELCLSLAKAMGEDELLSNLKYIFRTWDIPFMDDEEDDEYEESFSRKRKLGRSIKEGRKEMTPQYDSRKSFYNKAHVVDDEDGTLTLYSYNTPVCEIKDGKVNLLPLWDSSQTTLRHVKEFLKQNGFDTGSKQMIAKMYGESLRRNKSSKRR